MSAPVRIVYGARNTYALDPYVRDTAGRFAPHPATPPPPIQDLEAQGVVQVLANGAVRVGADTERPNYWKVRTVRNPDGTFRVVYLEEGA